jgi:hypothetical protein
VLAVASGAITRPSGIIRRSMYTLEREKLPAPGRGIATG